MADHIERIATLEANHKSHEKQLGDVVDKLDEIGETVNNILLNIEGKSGFLKGIMFACTVAASCVGGIAAWLVNKYYGH